MGGWLGYKAISEKGPVISIRFATAAGLEAGKTKIKYKDVSVGQVESIRLGADLKRVENQALATKTQGLADAHVKQAQGVAQVDVDGGVLVRAGQKVKQGEVVGYVGTTGLSTGCHLHLQIYRDGVRVNPMRYL